MNVILQGVVGSTAYGLATPESDVDTLGVFIKPTSKVLSFSPGDDTAVTHDPDSTLHEIGKYCSLALRGNPTILELMWLPEYTRMTTLGERMQELRFKFLSEKAIRNAYAGYAYQQISRLQRREAEGKDGFSSDTKKRKAKHARHCFRLLLQGRELLETGAVRIRLTEDEVARLRWIGEQDTETMVDEFTRERRKFDDAIAVVPEHPSTDVIEDFILTTRREHW
jgi:predicted nucleotidyltransferase